MSSGAFGASKAAKNRRQPTQTTAVEEKKKPIRTEHTQHSDTKKKLTEYKPLTTEEDEMHFIEEQRIARGKLNFHPIQEPSIDWTLPALPKEHVGTPPAKRLNKAHNPKFKQDNTEE